MLRYVLDTSALLTIFRKEEGTVQVREILDSAAGGSPEKSPAIYVPFASLMEFEYVSLRRFGRKATEQAIRMVDAWPVERVESSTEWGSRAARIKARAGLSFADAWNAALALMLDAELVHKDPEFDQVEGLRHFRLPYKEKKKPS